ncbi:MAG TPA: DUF3466 family protein [Pseudidiomarina sp.]|nr:DUF3466 family protein [Pseudidiomarina sp.]
MKYFTRCTLSVAIVMATTQPVAADVFTVTELETPNKVRNLFPVAINDQGQVNVLGRLPEDIEINLDRISASTRSQTGIPLEIEDPETFELSYEQYTNLVTALEDSRNPFLVNQRISFNFGGVYDGQSIQFYTPFEDTDTETPEREATTDHYFYGLNQNGIAVGAGTAPYRDLVHTYTPEEADEAATVVYSERDFTARAIWTDGESFRTYEPVATEVLGGESFMFDINDTNLAVGHMSMELSPVASERITECETEAQEPSAVDPVYVCVWEYWYQLQRSSASNIAPGPFQSSSIRTNMSIYDMRATLWQLDAQGQVISTKTLGTLMDRVEQVDGEDADLGNWSSFAYAVNNNGIAVGQSWTYIDAPGDIATRRIKMPAIYVDDEVIPVTTENKYLWGSADDINDNNTVIGFLLTNIQGVQRYVGYSFDLETETLSLMPGFFNGSSTIPTAINNNGIVVGSAEIEASLSTQRRRVGFMYDLNNPEAGFINLNDAVSCESGYFIVSAEGINEQGDIVATVVEPNEYTNQNGEVETEQVAKTILLNNVGGELNNCDAEEQLVERQGASTSPFALFGMLLIGGLITIRRSIAK